MTTSFENDIDKAPSWLKTDEGSQARKTWNVSYPGWDELMQVADDMANVLDYNQGFVGGQLLDQVARIVRLRRDGSNDNQLKLRITAAAVANYSHGDIDTLNELATAALGSDFIWIRENWTDGSERVLDGTWLLDGRNRLDGLPASSGHAEVVVKWYEWRRGFSNGFSDGFRKRDPIAALYDEFQILLDAIRPIGTRINVIMETV